jgi:lipopolysaccharide biosynthesis glycosyltransferase
MKVTFFGNRNAPDSVKDSLKSELINLIENFSADRFYVGNQGAFDRIVLATLRELKKKYSHIVYYVVLAYYPEDDEFESCSLYPEGIENVPLRYAISWRNLWLINNSDTVITYVAYTTGGASKFKNTAIKKGRKIIELFNLL